MEAADRGTRRFAQHRRAARAGQPNPYLSLTTFPSDFGRDWYFPLGEDPVPAEDRPPLPSRSLRELALGAQRTAEDPDEPRRTAEQDAAARAWWGRLSPEQRANWQAMANCAEPEDVYHVMREAIETWFR